MCNANCYLLIVPAPSVNISITSINQYGIYEGHNVSIVCEGLLSLYVDTDVTIVTEWYHNNQEIDQTEQISVINDELKNAIDINTVNGTFSGNYKCQMTISHKERTMIRAVPVIEDTIIPVTVTKEIQLDVQGQH